MDLWTVIILVSAVALIVYLMYRFIPASPMKMPAIWIVVAFVALWLAIKFLKPILSGIRF